MDETSAIPSKGDRSDAHVESQDQLWAERRIAERSSMLLMADIHTPDGASRANARIRNLSARGLMAECAWPSSPGAPVRFTLRGIGATAGRIAWNDGTHIGVAFDRPIDPRLTRKAVERTGIPVMVPAYLQGEPVTLPHLPGHPPREIWPPPFGKRV